SDDVQCEWHAGRRRGGRHACLRRSWHFRGWRLQRSCARPFVSPIARLAATMTRTLTRRAVLALGAVALGALGGLAGLAGAASRDRPRDQRITVGDLTLVIGADPWRLSLVGPAGDTLWEEAADQTLGYRTADGQVHRARRLASITSVGEDAFQLIAETDDPGGGAIAVEIRVLGPRALRLTVMPDSVSPVTAVLGGFEAPPDERFVGLGERFDSVNQRGRTVDVWAEDRRVAGYGPSTYAPIPLLLSSRGHGFALERFERTLFDLAATRPDRWTWEQDAPTASILVTYGP